MWNKITLKAQECHYWRIGKTDYYIVKNDIQWRYAVETSTSPSERFVMGEVCDITEQDMPWQTAIGEKSDVLQVLPALPDLPMVIKPKTKMTVLPGKSVMLYIPVPISLQFYAGSRKKEHLIFERATEELSQTWFGEFHNGLLAYSCELELADCLAVPKAMSHHIICPVKLVNDAHTILDVQRLLIHSEYLTVYGKDFELFANEVKIKFKGENEISDVQYASQAPSSSIHKSQLNSPRNPKMSSVISKSFHFIKSLSNY